MADAKFIGYDPVIFRQLRKLNLGNCTALEAIDLDAPKLEHLWASGATKLEILKIKAAIKDDVFWELLQTLPHLKASQIDIANCPNITAGRKKILSTVLYPARDMQIYERFLKGVLIYRPQEGSDVGMVKLPIVALGNPLEGTFDLSQCGDAGKYLSISTGYRKEKKPENEDKVEIWFAPRFLIEKELKTTAKHFQEIYGNWNENAEVGMFWTWWNDDLKYFDYLTTKNIPIGLILRYTQI